MAIASRFWKPGLRDETSSFWRKGRVHGGYGGNPGGGRTTWVGFGLEEVKKMWSKVKQLHWINESSDPSEGLRIWFYDVNIVQYRCWTLLNCRWLQIWEKPLICGCQRCVQIRVSTCATAYHFLLREHQGNELKNYPEQQDRKLVSN